MFMTKCPLGTEGHVLTHQNHFTMIEDKTVEDSAPFSKDATTTLPVMKYLRSQ